MQQSRVLLVSSNRERRETLLSAFRELDPECRFEGDRGTLEGLQDPEGSPSAAVCLIDRPDEIALVVRLRKAHRTLPILLITPDNNPQIQALGLQMGADRVLCRRSNLRRDAEGLLRTLTEIRKMVRTARHHIVRTRELVRDLRHTTRAFRELVGSMMGVAAACVAGEFGVLVVEDSETDYLFLTRALRSRGVPPFCRRVGSAEEALRYLGHAPSRSGRSSLPLPSLVVSDLHLPGMSGLDLLQHLRTSDRHRGLGFVLHTSSERPDDATRAARLGADLYVVKSSKSHEIAEILHSTFVRFMQERTGLSP